MTADTSHSSTQLPTYVLPILSLLSEPMKSFFQINKAKINSKILLHLSHNENGISGSLPFM